MSAVQISTPAELEKRYRAYINTLNEERWSDLGDYVSARVIHNDRNLSVQGYRDLTPPKTHFVITAVLVDVEKKEVASRLDITVDGKPIKEHCFYRFGDDWKIAQVWSMVEGL